MNRCILKAAVFRTVLAISLCTLSTTPTRVIGADIINGGFETGTLEGWTLSLAGDVWVNRSRDDVYENHVLYPFSSATIPGLANYASITTNGPEGTFCLELRGIYYSGSPGLYGHWTMDDGWTYGLSFYPSGTCTNAIRIEQTIHLSSGLTLSGWANYLTLCYSTTAIGHDPVSITVNGATVWAQDVTTVPPPTVGITRSTGWEAWAFTAPAEGDYTLAIDAGPACQYWANVYLDGVQVVPEPAVVTLGLLGVGMSFLRRK